MGIPVLKIRRSRDRLIFNMGIPILVRWHLYIEMAAVVIGKREFPRRNGGCRWQPSIAQVATELASLRHIFFNDTPITVEIVTIVNCNHFSNTVSHQIFNTALLKYFKGWCKYQFSNIVSLAVEQLSYYGFIVPWKKNRPVPNINKHNTINCMFVVW